MARIKHKFELLGAIDAYRTDEHNRDWIDRECWKPVDKRVARITPGPGSSILVEFYAGEDVRDCLTLMYHLMPIVKVPIYTYFNGVYIAFNNGE